MSHSTKRTFTFRPTGGFVDIDHTSAESANGKLNEILNSSEMKKMLLNKGIRNVHFDCDLVSESIATPLCGKYPNHEVLPNEDGACSLCGSEMDESGECMFASSSKPINSKDELEALQIEFADVIDVSNSYGNSTSKAVINAARNVIQHSTEDYSIVVPDSVEQVEVDGGSWIPVMVFIPDEAVRETYCEVTCTNGSKILEIIAESVLFDHLPTFDVSLCNVKKGIFHISLNQEAAEFLNQYFRSHSTEELLAFDYIKVVHA